MAKMRFYQPPESLRSVLGEEGYNYLLNLHEVLFGDGDSRDILTISQPSTESGEGSMRFDVTTQSSAGTTDADVVGTLRVVVNGEVQRIAYYGDV